MFVFVKLEESMNLLRKSRSLCLVSVCLLISAAVSVFAQPASPHSVPDFSGVRTLVRKEMVEAVIPSVTVAVARKGKIIWEEGFGWSNREKRIAATEHTMYYTASVTKTFTATALMILQQRKKIDLDRPINDYLGSAKLASTAWDPAGATVRRVETHTTGLTTFNPTAAMSIDEKIRRFGVLFWPPGERFDYSNLGPMILEDVVSRVSARSYPDFVREEVFWPLGMTPLHMLSRQSWRNTRRNDTVGRAVYVPVGTAVFIAALMIWRCSRCST